jgi:predicted O-methyltransferase YrrM
MNLEIWTAVEQYISDGLVQPDEILAAVQAAAAAEGLPPISVSPNQGKFLYLMAQILRAREILEIGTLAGYSAIWMTRGLEPGGRLVTLENDAHHARVAAQNFERAALSGAIDLRFGAALETLPRLAHENRGPFDLVFIDADKENNPAYFQWALTLARIGSLIVVDNVVREGAVLDAASGDKSVQGVRRLNQMMASEPRVSATTLQTVGSKGYDGFSVALVTG